MRTSPQTRPLRAWAGLLALSTFALGGGCGSDFPERSEIVGLRFLGIRTEPPWIRPGETATIEPLVVGSGRPLRYRWSWCPLLGPNSAEFTCLVRVEELNALIREAGFDFELPPDYFELGTEPTATFVYEPPIVPEAVRTLCESLRSREEVSNLVTLPRCDGVFPITVRVEVTDGEESILGFKELGLIYPPVVARDGDEVVLGPPPEPHDNPDITGLGIRILEGGGPATPPLQPDRTYVLELGRPEDVAPLEQLDRLSETFTATRAEPQGDDVVDVVFETREQLVLSWFADSGSYQDNRTSFLPETLLGPENPQGDPIDLEWARARTNEWTSPQTGDIPEGGETTLYVVIRDDRGGQSWTSTTVRVGAAR